MRDTERLTFDEWKEAVNDQVSALSVVDADDLPDVLSWSDYFESGMSPQGFAVELLLEAGYPLGE